jgi:TolB protein
MKTGVAAGARPRGALADPAVRWATDRSRRSSSHRRATAAEIYVLDPDDSATIRLTRNNGFDGLPDWSPDGSRIAFTSDMDGLLEEEEPGGPSDLELYTMAPDGSEVVRLTHNSRYEGESDWSPDGSRVAFDAADPFEDLQVYVMDSDGSTPPTVLTNGAPNGHPPGRPTGR